MTILIPLLLALNPAARAADLTAVVAAAVDRSPAVAETRARRAQAEAAGREATLSRLPRLSASGSFTRSDDPLFAFGALLQERRVTAADFDPAVLNRPGYKTAVHGALELGVPLFTGFALTRAGELAGLYAREADAWGGAAAQEVRRRTIDAYLALLASRDLLAELDERLKSAAAEVERAERLRKQGLVLGSDHQAALAILAGLRARRAQAAAESAAHGAELAALLGGNAPETSGALGAWTPPLEDDAALVAAALAARPDLRAADLRRGQAAVRVRDASASVSPVVDAFAAVQTSDDGLGTGAAAARMVGVRASLPFGDPAYFSRRARARADAEAAADARASLEDMVRGEVLARAAGVRGVAAVAPELDEALARARQSLDEVRPLYREGRQSVMEVLRAEEAVGKLTEARLDARRRLRADWAALRAAQGRLDDDAVATLGRSLEAAR
ncbi:MAG: TolC family protein [Elusimicrobia bacterium]|nr:TolC family protein [Elusimicrobiota bacterium]